MSVTLRLARRGRKKKPFYSIVAADKKSPRDGKLIEKLGYYNPNTDPSEISLDAERVKYWYGVGAELSDKVSELAQLQKIELVRGKTHKTK